MQPKNHEILFNEPFVFDKQTSSIYFLRGLDLWSASVVQSRWVDFQKASLVAKHHELSDGSLYKKIADTIKAVGVPVEKTPYDEHKDRTADL